MSWSEEGVERLSRALRLSGHIFGGSWDGLMRVNPATSSHQVFYLQPLLAGRNDRRWSTTSMKEACFVWALWEEQARRKVHDRSCLWPHRYPYDVLKRRKRGDPPPPEDQSYSPWLDASLTSCKPIGRIESIDKDTIRLASDEAGMAILRKAKLNEKRALKATKFRHFGRLCRSKPTR